LENDVISVLKKITTLSLFFSVLWAVPAFSHHGNFTYDGNTVITLQGEVVRFNYTNPHGSIILKTETGREVDIEVDGPSLIAPMGTDRNALQPGDRIVVYVSPNNIGRENEVLGREVIREDGSIVLVSVAYARQQERDTVEKAETVLGTWVPVRTNLFAFVDRSSNWVLTPVGQASFDAYDTSKAFAQAQCIAATSPTLMMYPTANRLTEVGGHIEINADWMGATRTVYMDGRDHPGLDSRYYQGHSVGYWEDETLVIETTNFSDNPIGNIFSIGSGAEKKLIERISVDTDGSTATYTFTLTDPDYLAQAVTASYQWDYRPDVSVSSQECDLEAAARYLQD
jgi:hypothetical protein